MRKVWQACIAVLGVIACFGVEGSADPASSTKGQTPLADLLQIVVLKQEIVAIAAAGGGQRSQALELGERVLWHKSRGAVGVALTDQRVLAVAAHSAAWQAARYRAGEQLPARALLGERVALVVTNKRVLGFDGGSANLVETELGPRERVQVKKIGANVAVAVTDRRALGLSAFRGGLFPVKLRLGEQLEATEALANLATVRTSQRLLTFRAPTGSWEERQLGLP